MPPAVNSEGKRNDLNQVVVDLFAVPVFSICEFAPNKGGVSSFLDTSSTSLSSSTRSACDPFIAKLLQREDGPARADAASAALVEMVKAGVAPDVDATVAIVTAFALSGSGARCIDAAATVAQAMILAGCSVSAVKDVVLHPRSVSAMLAAAACEGLVGLVRTIWTAYSKAASERRRSESIRISLVANTGYGLGDASAGSSDSSLESHMQGIYALSLAVSVGRVSGGIIHYSAASISSISGSSFGRSSSYQVSEALAAIQNLSSNDSDSGYKTIHASLASALAISLNQLGLRAQSRRVLNGAVQAFSEQPIDPKVNSSGSSSSSSSKNKEMSRSLDSDSFSTLVLALGSCHQTGDLRLLMTLAASSVTQSPKTIGPVGPTLASGRGAVCASAWVSGHSMRSDVAALQSSIEQLGSSPAVQRMRMNAPDGTVVSPVTDLTAASVAAVATVLTPSHVKLDGTISSILDVLAQRNVIGSSQLSCLASNGLLAHTIGSGNLREALLSYLPPVTSEIDIKALFTPLPETVTLLLQAVCGDINSQGKSESGLCLPSHLVPTLIKRRANTSVAEEKEVAINSAEGFIGVIQAILAAARGWGLRPRAVDIAIVIEVHAALGNVRLAMSDAHTSIGGPCASYYAALARGMARDAGSSFMEAEWVARNSLADDIDNTDGGLASAVESLCVRFKADLHAVFRTDESAGRAGLALQQETLKQIRSSQPIVQSSSSIALTSVVAISSPQIHVSSPAAATCYVFSRILLLGLADAARLDQNEARGTVGSLPESAARVVASVARSQAWIHKTTISTLGKAEETSPTSFRTPNSNFSSIVRSPEKSSAPPATSPLTASHSFFSKVPELVDEGHAKVAQWGPQKDGESKAPSGFEVFSGRSGTGTDGLPSILPAGSWKSNTSVPTMQASKVSSVAPSLLSGSVNSIQVLTPHSSLSKREQPQSTVNVVRSIPSDFGTSSALTSYSSSALTSFSSSAALSSTSKTLSNVSPFEVESLLRKDVWDYRALGFPGVAPARSQSSSDLDISGFSRNQADVNALVSVPDVAQLLLSLAQPSATFEAPKSHHARGKEFRGDVKMRSFALEDGFVEVPSVLDRRSAAASLPINHALLLATQKAGAASIVSSSEGILTDVQGVVSLSPETIVLQEACRDVHADMQRLELELFSQASQLMIAEAQLNRMLQAKQQLYDKSITSSKATRKKSGSNLSLTNGSKAALRYLKGESAQEDEPSDLDSDLFEEFQFGTTSLESKTVDGYTTLPNSMLKGLANKRINLLRNSLERLQSEESELLVIFSSSNERKADETSENFNSAMASIMSATNALEKRIEENDKTIVASEDAVLSTREGLRAWVGASARSSSGSGKPSSSALDAVSQLSSSRLSQASRLLRAARTKVEAESDQQLVQLQATVLEIEQLSVEKTRSNARVSAAISNLKIELDAATQTVEDLSRDTDSLKIKLAQLDISYQQSKARHAAEASRIEDAIYKMRGLLSNEFTRKVDNASIDVSRAMNAAAEKGRMEAAVEGVSLLEIARSASEEKIAKAQAETENQITPEIYAKVAEEVRSNLKFEDSLSEALKKQAEEAGKKREAHARVAASLSLLQSVESAMLRANADADHALSISAALKASSSKTALISADDMKLPNELISLAQSLSLTAFDLMGTAEEAIEVVSPNPNIHPSSDLSRTTGVSLYPGTDPRIVSQSINTLEALIKLYEAEIDRVCKPSESSRAPLPSSKRAMSILDIALAAERK
jgi:hypothetical protein